MSKTPLKKIIKAKLKANKKLTAAEELREKLKYEIAEELDMPVEKVREIMRVAQEKLKYEIAEELGLKDKVNERGWSGLTSEETGRIGGMMAKRKKQLNIPKNEVILKNQRKDK